MLMNIRLCFSASLLKTHQHTFYYLHSAPAFLSMQSEEHTVAELCRGTSYTVHEQKLRRMWSNGQSCEMLDDGSGRTSRVEWSLHSRTSYNTYMFDSCTAQ